MRVILFVAAFAVSIAIILSANDGNDFAAAVFGAIMLMSVVLVLAIGKPTW
jgi:hypothetical protein